MKTKSFTCQHCGETAYRLTGDVNKALKKGLGLYCNKKCAGLGRRCNKSLEVRKSEKAEYDKKFRELNAEKIKQEKKNWHKKSYDPVKAALARKLTMPRHVEYCRRPEYKAYKKEYDVVYNAKSTYGEFYESALLLKKIASHIDDREVRDINNLHNKTQKRKRYGTRKS